MGNTLANNKKVYEKPVIEVIELSETTCLLYASIPSVDDEEGA